MTKAQSSIGRICCLLGMALFCASHSVIADIAPTLELYSPYAVHTSATPLSLPVRLSLASSAPHGWTISGSEGALTVERLVRELGVGRYISIKEIRPSEVDSSPNSDIYFQQMAERQILEPGKSIELHLLHLLVFGAVGADEFFDMSGADSRCSALKELVTGVATITASLKKYEDATSVFIF